MANTTYNLLDDDGFLYAVQYIFTKLKTSPLNVNSTYTISLDTTNQYIVLTDDQGVTSHVSYSDFGDQNIIETVKVDNTPLTPDANKAINIPAASANFRGVVSNADINTLIQTALAGFERISFQKVNSYGDLPVIGQNGVIYLVPNSGTTPNIYDEYIWYTDSSTTPATSGYEKIGTTAVDLSGYVQYTDISLITNQEIATIVDDAYDAVFNPSNGGGGA